MIKVVLSSFTNSPAGWLALTHTHTHLKKKTHTQTKPNEERRNSSSKNKLDRNVLKLGLKQVLEGAEMREEGLIRVRVLWMVLEM